MNLFKGLYFRISLIFFLFLAVIGGGYVFVTAKAADAYFNETTQTLYKDVASQLLNEVPVFIGDSLNEEGVQKIMMHHMKVNPTVEVYIVDTFGRILTYDAPPEKILREQVPIQPIQELVKAKGTSYVLGKDPKAIDACKVFSAAPINDKNGTKGYVYAILNSEQYDSISSMLLGNYMYQVGTITFLIAVAMAFLIGMLLIRYLTKNFKVIEDGAKAFAKGEYDQDIVLESKGEFSQLAEAVNEMAHKLSGNIEELKQVEKLRKELVANVSHDLRTPIAVIHGYLETLLMKEGQMTPEQRETFLKTALSSTDNLKKIVEGLFELSKLESGKIQLDLERTNLLELMHDLSGRFKILAEKKQIRLEVTGCTQCFAVVDIGLLERAMQNLIENAIKFTPEKGLISIEVREEQGKATIFVRDTGVGISKESLPFVFDRYKKVDNHKDDNGSGLGLAIVKRIMDLHEATIQVQSEKGKGTEFTFQFPLVA